MGHYYSEMVSDEELDERAEHKKRCIEGTRFNLVKAIDEEGIATVLAKILVEAADRGIYIGNTYRSWR